MPTTAHQKLTAHLIDLEREHAEAIAASAWILAAALADCAASTREDLMQLEIQAAHEYPRTVAADATN